MVVRISASRTFIITYAIETALINYRRKYDWELNLKMTVFERSPNQLASYLSTALYHILS